MQLLHLVALDVLSLHHQVARIHPCGLGHFLVCLLVSEVTIDFHALFILPLGFIILLELVKILWR